MITNAIIICLLGLLLVVLHVLKKHADEYLAPRQLKEEDENTPSKDKMIYMVLTEAFEAGEYEYKRG